MESVKKISEAIEKMSGLREKIWVESVKKMSGVGENLSGYAEKLSGAG